MSGRLVLLSAVFVGLFAGCGGAAASAPREEGDQDPSQVSVAAAAEKSADPKVKEALERCDNEIAKADLQPPDTLSEVQIKACLYALNGQTALCGQGARKQVAIKLIIEKNGLVSNAFAVGDGSDSPEAACVIDVAKRGRFPKFKQVEPAVVKFAFSVGKQATP